MAYTDGVLESSDPAGHEMGEAAVIAAVESAAATESTALAIRDAVLEAADRHRVGAPALDDETVLVVRVAPSNRAAAGESAVHADDGEPS